MPINFKNAMKRAGTGLTASKPQTGGGYMGPSTPQHGGGFMGPVGNTPQVSPGFMGPKPMGPVSPSRDFMIRRGVTPAKRMDRGITQGRPSIGGNPPQVSPGFMAPRMGGPMDEGGMMMPPMSSPSGGGMGGGINQLAPLWNTYSRLLGAR